MIVVSDTSPLNYLILIGHVDVLPKLFGAVIVPRMVLRELARPASSEPVRAFADAPPSWIEVRDDLPVSEGWAASLDPGETFAIALARQLHADFLLIDDADGRSVATARGLRAMGTLGVLELGATARLVDLREAFQRLQQTTFRASATLFAEVLMTHEKGLRRQG